MGKPVRDKKYLRYVSELNPCWICGDTGFPVDAHHHSIQGVTQKGMGMKVTDYAVVPLCNGHHREGHQIGWKSFQEKHDVDLQQAVICCLLAWIKNHGDSSGSTPAVKFLERVTLAMETEQGSIDK